VTCNFGSLGEVVGDRGIMIDGGPHSAEFKERALGRLFQILSRPEAKKALQEKARRMTQVLLFQEDQKEKNCLRYR
jgi:hypothetical protein